MKNREIYLSALRLLAQDADPKENEDYEERAPYLLASVTYQTLSLDKKIRNAEGLGPAGRFSPVFLSLDLDFPLCDHLAFPAALYVASLLVIDEDPDLSDTLYEKYCDTVSSLQTSFSVNESTSDDPAGMAICESITEKYFYD